MMSKIQEWALICYVFIIMLFGIIFCCFITNGKNEPTNVEYVEMPVTIINAEYKEMRRQPTGTGLIITHPEEHNIIVLYNGVKYTFNDRNTYNKYKDKVGQTAIGILEIRTYDDGTIKYNITELE